MFSSIWHACKSLINRVKDSIKQWTKTAAMTLAVGAVSDIARSKSDLFAENAILRQLLIEHICRDREAMIGLGRHFVAPFTACLQTMQPHQTGDPLPAAAHTFPPQHGIDAWTTVCTVAAAVVQADQG